MTDNTIEGVNKFDTPELKRQAVEWLCNFLVGIVIRIRHLDNQGNSTDRVDTHVFSSTLIEVAGMPFLLTAGHILHPIASGLDSNRIAIESALLLDTFGQDAKDRTPIPFVIERELLGFMFEDDGEVGQLSGVDFGVIALRPFFAAQIAANGYRPVRRETWENLPDIDIENGGLILGFPSALAKEVVAGHQPHLRVEPVPIGITWAQPADLNGVPEKSLNTKYPRFKAKIIPDLGEISDSIDGMSGGPVVGFRERADGQTELWLVGVQSHWLPQFKLSFVCPLPLIGVMLQSVAERTKPFMEPSSDVE